MAFIDCNEQVMASKSKWPERPHCEHGDWISSGTRWKSRKANRKYMKSYRARNPEYVVKEYQRRCEGKREWAIKYLGARCGSCGQTEQWGIDNGYGRFQFDHVDPETKEFNITRYWAYTKKALRPELDKCQLLHVECHKAKTAQEVGQSATAKQDQLEALLNQYESEAA